MENAMGNLELSPHRFQNLSRVPGLVHGVFTRHGGVSPPPYATLNTAWNNGDSPDAVTENLSRIRQSMHFSELVSSIQVHGDTIHLIDDEALSRLSPRGPVLVTQPGDALVTRLVGVGLLIKIADCQAIFLVDPVKRAIANVHCGWRGSVMNLPGKVVSFLQERFGSNPGDLLGAISPSLGPCCGEFRNYREELPESFHPFQSRPEHFDFWKITVEQLTQSGMLPTNIELAGRCTVCENRHFFSYRGEGETGRNGAVLGWTQ